MNIQESISLLPYNTFQLAIKAKYFTEVTSKEDLRKLLKWEKYNQTQKLVVGGGSNILFTKDFEGLIILNQIKGIEKVQEDDTYVWFKVGGGEVWHTFAMYCVKQNLGGIENLSLIPGSVGAAPIQNIGAYGVEQKDVFVRLEAVNLTTGEIKTFTHSDCQFGYRDSIFKRTAKGQYFISSVTYQLRKQPLFNTSYGDIQQTLAENNWAVSVKTISDAVIQIRQSKLPDPKEIGNSGSFFKNPEISQSQYESLKEKYPNVVAYPTVSGMKLAAGWLIDQCGWKGYRDGEIGIHTNQALVLVNYGAGKGNDLKELAFKIQNSVYQKFGVELTPEVNII